MLNTSNDLRLDKQPIPIPGVPVVPGLESIPPRMNQTEIILLENAIYWWVYPVIILYEKDSYRLIVIRKRKVLFDKTYKTISDAKTDFEMHFTNSECIKIKYKGEIDGEPKWNDSHLADQDWLDPILKLLEKPFNTLPSKKGNHNSIGTNATYSTPSTTHSLNQTHPGIQETMNPGNNKNSSKEPRVNKRGPHAKKS